MKNTTSNFSCAHCESRKLGIFCELGAESLHVLEEGKHLHSFKKGQVLFHWGEKPEYLYCLNSGIIKLESPVENGNVQILRIVGAGGIIGYRALFAEENYQATAVVQQDAEICLVRRDTLFQLLSKEPNLAMKFVRKLSRDLGSTEDRLTSMTSHSAPERVAEALLFFKKHFADNNWTRREISEWAGTTTETVIRILADFERDGLIAQEGRRIEILERNKLIDKAALVY